MNIMQDFGLRLKELRLRSSMSQDTLASLSGLDRTYIGGVERGERNVSLKNIEILCNTLDVDISYFFADERFTLHTAFLKSELSKPLEERFRYTVQNEENIIAWQVTGALHLNEVKKICLDLKSACRQLASGKVKLLIDNSKMMTKDQPIAFQHEVTAIWEELQRWFLPHCEHVIVLCNSRFMQNQMNRLAKRSGIIKVQKSLFVENGQWLADGEDDLLHVIKEYLNTR
ncbi:helix-turn-helix domain-containing protein [Paenibacillus qinlingensis]|uniref:helix-turn-helix domain-containing protein n=1 Tax=Paenibacillus qinlingensis TaxID=1837343 RepID=UPI001567333F|nr:helix-turn-helix transcriptional regulator [Paenibacillus qinlingensis]NQX59981.1 helix-turn-helix transcriptional regulator [Paenibacillus qinlingensis]